MRDVNVGTLKIEENENQSQVYVNFDSVLPYRVKIEFREFKFSEMFVNSPIACGRLRGESMGF